MWFSFQQSLSFQTKDILFLIERYFHAWSSRSALLKSAIHMWREIIAGRESTKRRKWLGRTSKGRLLEGNLNALRRQCWI